MARTFTESGRRSQIVQAAIEVIAEAGYAKATFARIAKHAGLSSTGMISYHFAGKDDLLREVVAEVLRVSQEYMVPRIEAETGARARLHAYVRSNVELVAVHPRHLAALLEVLNVQGGDSEAQFAENQRAMMEMQEGLVRMAQASGEYGAFDARVLVTALRGAIDAVLVRTMRDPEMDVATSARELAELFDRAVRPVEVCMEPHRGQGES
ncbi:TetR/AcrR family transcriptional regulator [Kitasatospora sp. NPDC049285]|uniref:TetR/AcrR family transcriptional regulator n=1 Tax=Kitasatospora sp. NPDC049285 TaxID=3157096 RepID=UPI00342540DF